MGCGTSRNAGDLAVEPRVSDGSRSWIQEQNSQPTSPLRASMKRTTSFSLPRGTPKNDDDGDDVESLFPKSPSMRRTNNDSPSRHRESIGNSIGHLIDSETGLISRSVSRTMSHVSNCHLEADKDANGTVLLADEETGQSIKIIKQIGKGGFGRVFLGEYAGVGQVAIKAVFGERSLGVDGELAAEGSQEAVEENRERMVQMEALLMSLLSGHPNIVHTYKCLGESYLHRRSLIRSNPRPCHYDSLLEGLGGHWTHSNRQYHEHDSV